jgi:hypothetical protein
MSPRGRRFTLIPNPSPSREKGEKMGRQFAMTNLRHLLYQGSIVVIAAWGLTLLPSPTEAIPLRLKNGIVGIVAVLSLGKLLYDSLFFDRYRP